MPSKPRTLLNVKIKTTQGWRDILAAMVIIGAFLLFLALFALGQIVVCQHDAPSKTYKDCLFRRG